MKKQLKELCMFSLEKRRLRGDTLAIFKDLEGYNMKHGASLFPIAMIRVYDLNNTFELEEELSLIHI